MSTAPATGTASTGASFPPNQRRVSRDTPRATSAAASSSPATNTGSTPSGGPAMSIPASLVMRRRITQPARHEHGAYKNPRDLPEPEARTRLRDQVRLPGVHVPLPEDGPARLRDHPRGVRARRPVRRAQVVEAVPLVVSQRGGVSRGGDEPDPRRPGRGLPAA